MTEPRSTRAVSEDGRWVVRLLWTPSRDAYCWTIGERRSPKRMKTAVDNRAVIPDTGQSAEQVLAEWEQEQGDGD